MRVLQASSQGTDNSQVISAYKMLILKERQWKKAGSPVLYLLGLGFLLAFKPAALPAMDSARIPLMCSMTRDKHQFPSGRWGQNSIFTNVGRAPGRR